ncbi:MAG: hypothetical protein EPO20_14865 [Betaproteobacteria bacterium]|nr:MAG: hypothetical protein EPO20_14865 [Betaproteobacteria bacterium]
MSSVIKSATNIVKGVFGGGPEGPNVGDGALAAQQAEEARKAALRERIAKIYGMGDDPEAQAAKARMTGEEAELAKANRGFYTDELGRQYQTAERGLRFKLARSGQLGGSEDVNQFSELRGNRDLGATRIDQAVAAAVNSLIGQREQERLNAINLVNAGSGEDAVTSANRGLQNALRGAQSQQRADLFSDLFRTTADTVNAAQSPEAALLARYKNQLSTYFPQRQTAGRVTPTA